MIHQIALIISNALLAMYPIMIKWYPHISLLTQTFIRILIILLTSFFFTSPNILKLFLLSPAYILIGLINIIHIYTSYAAFKYLNAGIATGLFYTYPIFILLLSWIFLHESFSIKTIIGLLICFISVLFIQYNKIHDNNHKIGYFYIFIAAITEAIIILFYKSFHMSNSFDRLFTLYALSIIPISILLYFSNNSISLKDFTQLSGFHIIFGFGGYLLRLFAVDLPTNIFSLLSYSQIIFAFLYGSYFLNEYFNLTNVIGIILLIIGLNL